LRQADHSSKGVLPSVLLRLQDLQFEAAEVLTKTAKSLMMMMMTKVDFRCSLLVKERERDVLKG
jgi:capsid protein